MSTQIDPIEKARLAAEQAQIAAENARDGAEVAMLAEVTKISQITTGRTSREANRLKSRLISTRGYDAWVKICADSRP